MRTTTAQISLRIRAVWLAPLYPRSLMSAFVVRRQDNIYSYCTYVDIQKFNTKYLVMYKVQMHTGAIG